MARKKQTESANLTAKEPEASLAPEFVKIEKNLNSLGFFTPSSKTTKGAKAKTITFTRVVDGKKAEAKVTIAPASLYGLPVTADQDKYLALQKIIGDIKQESGEVQNPVAFSSAQLLQLLGQVDSGKNYSDVLEWLKRMTATTIISEGAVYFAGRKKWAQDTFHVFDRSVAAGQELPDGTIAEKNFVWLSAWQLENINNNYLLPIDFEAYKKLKSHIAKALVPMLQVWLFASAERGSFEKRYDELCQYLNISQCKHLSKIRERLSPALDELKAHGYLSKWKIEPASDQASFKIVFYHGEKFHRDRKKRLGQSEAKGGLSAPVATPAEAVNPLLSLLVERGVRESAARELLATLPPDQPVQDQVEWADELVKREGNRIKNVPGFLIHLLKSNSPVPEDFVTSCQRAQHEARRAQAQTAQHNQLALELAYEDHCQNELDKYIAEQISEAEKQAVMSAERKRIASQFNYAREWDEETWRPVLLGTLRRLAKERLPLISFAEFASTFKAP